MFLGKSLGRRALRRLRTRSARIQNAADASSVQTRQLSSASRRVVESLESRVLLHAGEHLDPTLVAPYNGQQKVAVAANVAVTFASALNTATLNADTFQLRDANNNLVPAAISYNPATLTATLDPAAALTTTNGYFTATLKSGVDGVRDAAGLSLDEDFTWNFTTGTPTFTESTVFSGLVEPTNVQFSPDGRVFVAEKSGLIKVFSSLTSTTPTIFADLRTQVHNFWDRGLLGLALDPQFTTGRPYVYVLYSYDGDIGGPAPKYGTVDGVSDPGPDATGQGAKISGRLSRLTASGNTAVPGSEKILIADWQQQFPSHSIGSVGFGPDGALYASAGEGASFSYADYGQTGNPFGDPVNEGGALRAQDLQTPNDPTTLGGSIIRVDPDTGLALPDNPLYTTGKDQNAKRIIAEGFRNPFRFTFRPGTNEIWAGDVGAATWDEIDRVQISTTQYLNFGWPAYEGVGRQPGYDALNLPVLENLYAKGPSAVVAPYFTYKHSEQIVPGSAEPTGGSSPSGIAFYSGASYPSAYKDALFFADYSRRAIYVMYKGVDGLPDPATRQIFLLGKSAAMLKIGPNGDLFYVDLFNGAIKRFQFFSANRPPAAVVTADKTSGGTPLTVNFSAASSSDPDAGDTLTYAWDLNGDGLYTDSTFIAPSKTYTVAGVYTVGLKVTDSKGATNLDTVVISVGNTAPTAAITTPLTTLKWKVGDTINFAGTGTDLQDGKLSGASLTWQLLLRHENLAEPANFHYHLIQEYTGASGSFVAPNHEYPSKLELRLVATDSGGLTSTTAVAVLQPQTATITIKANLAGIQVGLNDASFAAPTTQTVIVGSSSSLVAITPQTIGGVLYNFSSWSDGGAATHNVTALAAGGTYTANYVKAPALPTPWVAGDIGPVGVTGNSTYDSAGKKFIINGAGADIWGTSDSFRYVYQTLTGDGSIVARVASFQETNTNAKAGVQFRQSLAPNSANVQMDLEGAQDWAEFHVRASAGAETSTANVVGPNPPYWVKLTRAGNLFSGFISPDGVNWELVSSATVAMTAQVYVGLVVCSHNTSEVNTAVFDNVTVAKATVITGDVTAGLTHRYKLDENAGTNAADSVGTKPGTLTGGATWTPGKVGSAVNLDGVSGLIDTGVDLSPELGTTASLTAWIKTTQVGSADFWLAPGIAGSEQDGGGNDVFWGILDAAGRISIKAGGGAFATSTSAVNDGQWHFVAFTRNAANGQLQVFVDGVLQAIATGEAGNKTTRFSAFGRIEHDVTDSVYLKGGLDDIRTYNRVLSFAEIASIKSTTGVTPVNTAPTVASAAKVSPVAPLVGVAANLSVLGADTGGEAGLKYTWSVVTSPAGAKAPVFGANGTNAAKATTVNFATAGAYTLRVTISDGLLSVTSNVSMTVTTFAAAKINFQPSAAATVSGYGIDFGNVFGARTNSLAYGWNTSHTTSVFDRGVNSNQLLDTVLLMKAGAKWEIALPNGTYSVKVSVGDASAAAVNTIRVEGISVFSALATAAKVFSNKTISVAVRDGRLTLDNGSAAALATHLNFIEITRTGA